MGYSLLSSKKSKNKKIVFYFIRTEKAPKLHRLHIFDERKIILVAAMSCQGSSNNIHSNRHIRNNKIDISIRPQ